MAMIESADQVFHRPASSQWDARDLRLARICLIPIALPILICHPSTLANLLKTRNKSLYSALWPFVTYAIFRASHTIATGNLYIRARLANGSRARATNPGLRASIHVAIRSMMNIFIGASRRRRYNVGLRSSAP